MLPPPHSSIPSLKSTPLHSIPYSSSYSSAAAAAPAAVRERERNTHTTTMIQTINPYATARTAEIMSRYRPIAPKPESPAATAASAADNDASAVPNGIRKSPYLRNVWAHLQARPTRTRKRGRTAAFSPPSAKRPRACLQGLSPPYHFPMHGFTQVSISPTLDAAVSTLAESVALPLLYCAQPPAAAAAAAIDLNSGPEELDLLLQLEPLKPSVISPRPVRPVGSSITVDRIADDPVPETLSPGPEEVEEVVEAEAVPAIVSDSNNKVRMCNSAYKEMVGQPECCWLECATGKRRIGGEVSLQFADDAKLKPAMMAAAFTCAVKIEWEREGKKVSVNGSCSAVKLVCESKDYQFLWRFHTSKSDD